LRFSPVLLGGGGAVLDRDALPKFGRYFLTGNRFASPAAAPPMFVERAERPQALLFEVRASAGLPYDRETVIAEDDVFAFVERHRGARGAAGVARARGGAQRDGRCGSMGRSSSTSRRRTKRFLEVEITFRAGDETITATEIARARREGIRALIRGNLWIDVTDPQFAWLDDATLGPRGHILVTKLELLRIRGSLRGKAVFRGDPACERMFRLFDEIQTDADAPSPRRARHRSLRLSADRLSVALAPAAERLRRSALRRHGPRQDAPGHRADRALAHVDPSQSMLVVCPTSLIDHWREKLARYLPGVPVTLTTYGLVRSRIEQFRGKRFDLLVLDEMQTIKNADTATHHALRGIEKRIAVGLTGTPIENHEGELKALLDFVVPGYLPKHVDDRMTLQRLVRPFVLRRTKAQVLTELPPKIVDKRFCELTSEQRTLYRRVLEARAKPLRAKLRAGETVSYVHIFAALNYLKQICNHPASVGGGFGDGTCRPASGRCSSSCSTSA
jgi:hypothetical protein